MLRRIRYYITAMRNESPNTMTQKESDILYEETVKGLLEEE